jgi:PPK2 family polyphosphate:nucleotide phosphotransferase
MSFHKIDLKKFEVSSGEQFSLKDHSTSPEIMLSKKESKSIIQENVKAMRDIQERMYANRAHSALFVFQAIDAAGKDGTIERLVTGINPQGVKVHSFKKPTEEELSHDFLWRVQKKLPPNGLIGIFNRSHYEETLVVRVHPEYLIPQRIPGINSPEDVDEALWQRRFKMIRNFEQNLVDTGTMVVKFFLYVSKEEQKARLLKRIAEPEKHWKFKLDDVYEREHWSDYAHAFEQAIKHTATAQAPWYVIPADHKATMRTIVTGIARTKLEEINADWPQTSEKQKEEITFGKEVLEGRAKIT